MTTPIRKIVIGENHRSVAVLNRPVEDILSGSGYSSGGEDFAGFSTVAALAAEATARGAGDGLRYLKTEADARFMPIGTFITVTAYDATKATFTMGALPDLSVPSFGTAGTLVGVTASTTNNSTAIVLSAGHGIANGSYVTIGSMVGAFVLSAVGATSATLNRVATATLAGAAVQYIRLADPLISIGYNQGRISKGTEPEWVSQWETDFIDSDGYRKMEHYLQYTSGDGGTVFRPYFFQVNRDLKRLEYGWLEVGAQGLFIQDTSAVVLASFTLTSNTFIKDTTFSGAVTINGLVNATSNAAHLFGSAGAGSANTSIILNAQTTGGVAAVRLQGAGSQLVWQKDGSDFYQWYVLAGDAHVYFRDLANGRMHVTYTPGASATAALTQIGSRVQIDGAVGFNGTAPVTKPTFAAASTDLASVITLANDIRARLINYGLGA